MKRERVPCGCIDPEKVVLKGEYMIVRREKEAKTRGGLVIPEGFREDAQFGVVVRIAPEIIASGQVTLFDKNGIRYNSPIDELQVGARVVLHGHTLPLLRFTWGGEIFDIVKAEDVVAIDEREGVPA